MPNLTTLNIAFSVEWDFMPLCIFFKHFLSIALQVLSSNEMDLGCIKVLECKGDLADGFG